MITNAKGERGYICKECMRWVGEKDKACLHGFEVVAVSANDPLIPKRVNLETRRKPLCEKYLGDNDGTCPQLTCIRDRDHDGLCDNTRGDHDG